MSECKHEQAELETETTPMEDPPGSLLMGFRLRCTGCKGYYVPTAAVLAPHPTEPRMVSRMVFITPREPGNLVVPAAALDGNGNVRQLGPRSSKP